MLSGHEQAITHGMKRVRYGITKPSHLVRRVQEVRHHDGDHPSGMRRANTIVRILKNKASRRMLS
jgi:hypothetical protein